MRAYEFINLNENDDADFIWHGSRNKIDYLEPRQAVDIGGHPGSNRKAVYATGDKNLATQMGMTTAGSDTGRFMDDPSGQMILYKGDIRKGEKAYLHKLPKNLFVPGGAAGEYYSKPDVKGIKPLEVHEVPVDDYIHLIRQPTQQDLDRRQFYLDQAKKVKQKMAISGIKGGGGSGGVGVPDIRDMQMGAEFDPKRIIQRNR